MSRANGAIEPKGGTPDIATGRFAVGNARKERLKILRMVFNVFRKNQLEESSHKRMNKK